ncbi:hypothetical protein P0136_06310 [Lentisphaerota bacterium ZTH]|nr:hypothetical protein JYG24_02580 [Lentisphaerota bacterium]WET07603.1 hypothetical protein P0136_06310 [Lentisphaerota bacterium ZTH]
MYKRVIAVAIMLTFGIAASAQEKTENTTAPAEKATVQDVQAPAASAKTEQPAKTETTKEKKPDYSKTTTTTTTTKTVTRSTTPEKAEKPKKKSGINPAYCLARGLTNITFCWLELPRCMIYDNAQIPFFGLIVGVPEGVLFTVARAFTGVFDIVTLGFSGEALHGPRFPDFVFQSNWLPPDNNE